MRYIIGSGYTAQDDGGLIRLYHNGTIETKDVGIAETAEVSSSEDTSRAIPVRARSRMPLDPTRFHAVPQTKNRVHWKTSLGISLIMTLVGAGVYAAYLFSPFSTAFGG